MVKRGIPTPPEIVDPLTTTWKAGQQLYRVHPVDYEPNQLNPGTSGHPGRFHPMRDVDGKLVPTLYAADCIDGALSETIFHDTGAGQRILGKELATRHLSQFKLNCDIQLADFTGHGLRRLGLSRKQLLECEVSSFTETAKWVEAIHRSDKTLKGLVWVSRQFDRAKTLMVFGDRLPARDFSVLGKPERLDRGASYERVQNIANMVGITIIW